jgi:hypothetical protein
MPEGIKGREPAPRADRVYNRPELREYGDLLEITKLLGKGKKDSPLGTGTGGINLNVMVLG